MKKTISINISGHNFHIDEDAYEKLHRYLEAIKMHFRGLEGSEEVMADIEARISEILQSRTTETRQVISLADVEEVIRIMGQPIDFAPEGEEEKRSEGAAYFHYQKRLYRDMDNKVLGGVCSGIGAYFNLDPVWVRLIFILLVFASGFGILIYAILWMVVPEARTAAERLEMRGQPVNVSTLEQTIRSEVGDLKEKVSEMADKARDSFKRRREYYAGRDRSYVKDNIHSVGNFFLRLVGIFTGILLFLIALSISLGFAFAIFRFPEFSMGSHTHFVFFPIYPFFSTLFENDPDLRTFAVGLVILLGIPLLLLMLVGLRLIFNIPSFRYINGAAGWIFLITLILTVFFGLKIAGSFRYQGESVKEHLLRIPAGDTLHIGAVSNLPEEAAWHYRSTYRVPDWGLYLTDYDHKIYGIPRIRITESPDSSIHLNERFYARGSSRSEAMETAEAIPYPWTLDSNRLLFPESFAITPNDKWRKQELLLELKLPKGCIFKTDEEVPTLFTGTWGMSRHEMQNAVLMITEEGVHQYVP